MYVLQNMIISILNMLLFPANSQLKSRIFGICSTHWLIKDSPSIPCCNWWLVSSSWLFSKMQPTTLRLVGCGFTSESPQRDPEKHRESGQNLAADYSSAY